MKLDLKEWINKVGNWITLNRIQTVTMSGTTNGNGAIYLSSLPSNDVTVLTITVTSGGVNYFGLPFKYNNSTWYAKILDWQNLVSQNNKAVSLKIWYVVGGVVRKLLKALKPLTLGRGWAV